MVAQVVTLRQPSSDYMGEHAGSNQSEIIFIEIFCVIARIFILYFIS